MKLLENNIRWIMLIAGVLTCSTCLAIFNPQLALQNMFGGTLDGALAEVVVRSWGALVTLVGAMLIYASNRPLHRSLVLVVATISKLVFVGLVISFGKQFLGHASIAIAFDSLVIVLFILYLLSSQGERGIE